MEDTRKNFMLELCALLEKYAAEITCEDHYQGYPECGQDVRMNVEFDGFIAQDINLGWYVDRHSVSELFPTEETPQNNNE